MDDSLENNHQHQQDQDNTPVAAAAVATTSSSSHHQNQDQNTTTSNNNNNNIESLNEQLAAESARIQMELERLKMRRKMIEDQRRALVAAQTPQNQNHHRHPSEQHNNNNRSRSMNNNNVSRSGSHTNNNNRSSSTYSATNNNNHHRSHSIAAMTHHSDLTNVITHSGDLPPGGTRREAILPESKRRSLLMQRNSPHFQMKEAIKASLLHDSTIVSGTFMPNPHASKNGSFGRAARFSRPQSAGGRHGPGANEPLYYLSYDMQQLQGPKCRDTQRGQIITASGRGRVGTNVNSHWNDAKGGVAPGPGAYTPRYWFCSNAK